MCGIMFSIDELFRRPRRKRRSRSHSLDRDTSYRQRSYPNTPVRRARRSSRSRSPSPRDRRERRDREGRHTRDDDDRYDYGRRKTEDVGRRRDRDRDISPGIYYPSYSSSRRERDDYDRRYSRDDDRRGSFRDYSPRPEDNRRNAGGDAKRATHRRYTSDSQFGSRDTNEPDYSRNKMVSSSPSVRSHTSTAIRSPPSVPREKSTKPVVRPEDKPPPPAPKVRSPSPMEELSTIPIILEKSPSPIEEPPANQTISDKEKPDEPKPEAMETEKDNVTPVIAQEQSSPVITVNTLSIEETQMINSIWDTRIE
jgi:hypothetical protein